MRRRRRSYLTVVLPLSKLACSALRRSSVRLYEGTFLTACHETEIYAKRVSDTPLAESDGFTAEGEITNHWNLDPLERCCQGLALRLLRPNLLRMSLNR